MSRLLKAFDLVLVVATLALSVFAACTAPQRQAVDRALGTVDRAGDAAQAVASAVPAVASAVRAVEQLRAPSSSSSAPEAPR
jgi:hypothetical protein